MDGNVVRLGGKAVDADASAEFQRVLAANIEGFVEKFGHAPQSLVFVLSDAEANVLPSWLVREACEGRAAGQIAIASVVLGHALTEAAE
jgi:hypothetical protein